MSEEQQEQKRPRRAARAAQDADPLMARAEHRGQHGSAREALAATEAEAAEVKGNAGEALLAAQERGYWGFVSDPTPNENYTVAGVNSGAPTPETDEGLAVEAAKRSTLPRTVPFLPGTQEQFDTMMQEKRS